MDSERYTPLIGPGRPLSTGFVHKMPTSIHIAETDEQERSAFWVKVRITERGCWIWQGAHTGHHYGAFFYRGRLRKAHRVAWELTQGPIPDGLVLMHLCHTKDCVRPEHLQPGTQAENMQMTSTLHRRGRLSTIPVD